MDGREMIVWILLLQLSVLMVQAFDNRPVDHQRKILVRMVWPRGHVTSQPDDDTTPQPVVIPAATFSRQMIIRFPSSGSIHPDDRKPSIVSSAGYDPFATEESADYSLDSYVSLSLTSGGSDAEGADQNLRKSNLRNEKSFEGGKLDFLQQLLRFAPSAEGDEDSDKCNHPLHSWMCKNKAVPTTTNGPPVTTTAARQQPEFFPASAFENVQILIPDLSPTVVPPLPAPPLLPVQGRADEAQDAWAGMDPCNHPFHSWMCAKQRPKIVRPPAEFKQTAASILDQNLLLPPLESTTSVPITTTPALPATTKRSGWDGVDPCTHPFHSWLCDKRQPAARTTSARPLPPTTTTSQPFIPDASFFIPDINPPAAPPTTTTPPPPPPTTLLPLLIRTLAPKKGWDEADSCSHPFHSWLCEKPKIRTTTPQFQTVPPTTTVAPLPPPEEAVLFEPAPSMEEANQLVAEASPPPPTTSTTIKPIKSSGWDEADSCSHPFHSWLCAKPQVKTRTTRPPTTTPPPLPADGQQPDASNFESLDALPLPPPQILTTQKPDVRVAPTEASGWADGADPCTHPFHSWLCKRAPSVRQNLRIGRQSDRAVKTESEALDEENMESSRWNTFESLRLPPSIGHPK